MFGYLETLAQSTFPVIKTVVKERFPSPWCTESFPHHSKHASAAFFFHKVNVNFTPLTMKPNKIIAKGRKENSAFLTTKQKVNRIHKKVSYGNTA